MRPVYAAGRLAMKALLHLAYRIETAGLEHVPAGRALLLASNHQSNWDPPLIGCCLPVETGFVAKRQLFANPVVGALLRAFGSIPIDRGGVDRRALKEIRSRLREGRSVLLFPEGTRSRDGSLGEARAGLGLILEGVDADVLPVCVLGTIQPARFGRRPRVRVEFGAPVTRAELEAAAEGADDAGRRSERHQRLTETVFARIRALHEAASTPGTGLPR